jgi:phosphomethylpyrimidine synthase
MKITQEVREFAAKQNSDSYLAATAPVEGAEEGMDEMAEKYREGGDLYMPAEDRL